MIPATQSLVPVAARWQLATSGYCVLPQWLPASMTELVRTDALMCEDVGLPRRAGISTAHQQDANVRLSSMLPLIPPPRPSAGHCDTRIALAALLRDLCDELDSHASEVGLSLPLEPFSTEMAYLYYPEGGRYMRHMDVPQRNDGWVRSGRSAEDGGSFGGHATRREVSVLLYLNRGWDPAWGGQLRIYHADDSYLDVPPEGGSLVLMRSDRVPHEVLPTSRPRQCVVGWFRSTRYHPHVCRER